MDTFFKQPVDILDYDADFTRWLSSTDVVTSATASIDIVGELAIDAIQIPAEGNLVKVWLSGGVNLGRYKISVRAATAEGRTKEVDFILRVKDC